MRTTEIDLNSGALWLQKRLTTLPYIYMVYNYMYMFAGEVAMSLSPVVIVDFPYKAGLARSFTEDVLCPQLCHVHI